MQIYQAKNQKNNKKLLKIFFENKKIIIKINFILKIIILILLKK